MKCFESIFVRGVRIILFVVKKGFQLNVAKEFFNVLLNWKFVGFFSEMGTKFKPLLGTDFSELESGKFSGMVTTVLMLWGDESLVIWGPISWSSWSSWSKFKPLLGTDFSELESGKFSGMVTTVLMLWGDESLVIWGPISWSSFWALIWCKFNWSYHSVFRNLLP